MSRPRLVTDADAELMAQATESCVDWTQRLLATRAACVETLGRIEEMVGEGFADVVVANTMLGRIKREARALLAELHEEKP